MKRIKTSIAPMYPIIAIAALLQFCAPKAHKTTAGSGYDEDLSVYRSEYKSTTQNNKRPEVIGLNELATDKPNIEPTHHIRTELDSVKSIIIAESKHIHYVDGYTIQLYSGNDRDKANEMKRKAYELIEGVRPRVSYEQPNYKVRVGKYYDQLEANADFALMRSKFSRAVLVPTKIRIDQD